MGKEIHEFMNLQIQETSYFGETFRVIVYCPTPKNDKSELFHEIAKILIDLVGFGRNQRNFRTMFSELKAVADSEKF